MEKNILVTFLSDVKLKKDGVSIQETPPFENIGGSEPVQTTNESAVRYLVQKFPLDKIFMFGTWSSRNCEYVVCDFC